MSDQPEDAAPRRRNIVVGKAQGEWGDTLPHADVDTTAPLHEHDTTVAAHPPIIGIEEMPPATERPPR
jgi:hypothetical protein